MEFATQKTGLLVAYTAAAPCTNNNFKLNGGATDTLVAGVYFISGTLTLVGGTVIDGTAGVTFILLPGANIDTSGKGTLNITGPTSAPSASSLPASLQSDASLFQDMAIYDASSADLQFGGNSNITLKGDMYAPTAAVTFQGNPTINAGACGNQLIASSIAFNGNPTLNFDFNNQSCPQAIQPTSQLVQLIQ